MTSNHLSNKNPPQQLELISFNLCPFVQRSVITLLKKNIDFKLTFIDLTSPPSWFLELSPLQKVPLLKVAGHVLFESAIINMYLDEITPPALEPTDPLLKAENRAWIEFCSTMIMNQYHLALAENEAIFRTQLEILRGQFALLAAQLGAGPYFNGAQFSLVDAAYAPLFMRFNILSEALPIDLYPRETPMSRWCQQLTTMECVTKSVVGDFQKIFQAYFIAKNGYYAKQLMKQ